MKRKKLLCLVLCFLMMNTLVACRLGNLSLLGKSNDGSKEESESTSQQEEEVYISNDVQAAYYHDFVNLIPFYEDVPYISIDGHGLYPKISYNQLSIVQNNRGEEYPYERLRKAYSYALSDIYVLNGRLQDEYEMAQFFYCNNSVTYMNGEELSVEEWNEYDGLLWYMTFLNYHCDIETEDDENGTLVHVKISNTDMVKLLYEELMNTQMMVKEDNQAAAAERMNGAFDHVKTYFKNQAENYDHIDHWDITHPAPGYYTVYPVYGNSLVSKLNLVQLAGGLIFEQAKYQKNREYWGNLSDDGTLYNYTLSNMLLRMADGDYDTVDNADGSVQATDNKETNEENSFSFINDYVSSVAEKEAANITYEIVSSEINEDDAIVKVKVSYNNYGPVAKMAFKILYDKIITNTFSGIDMNEDDMVAVFVAAFENEQQNVAIIKKTETIEVPCRYVDKKWMITDYSAIQNIYYCNIYGALSELGGDDSETEGTDDGSGKDGNQSENSPEKSAGQENASKTSNDDEPYGPGVTYFQDEGYKITVQEFVYWDSYNEYELILTYVGHDMSGYVGDYTLSHLDDDGEIEEVSGTFHEGYDGKGKLKYGTENIPYWKENNEGTYVLTIDESMFNGRGDLRMVDKEWADANAGSVG